MTQVATDAVFRPTVESTLRQLQEFILGEVRTFRPDRVIVAERKGTAIYRAVLESVSEKDRAELLPWSRVISSDALTSLAPEQLRGQRILVIDDMMRRGNTIRRILETLLERGVTDDSLSNVRVAAFAMHEEAGLGRHLRSARYPHVAWLRYLPREAYRETRASVVDALQAAGSLMLDTEHVEIRLRLKVPLNRLASALTRTGSVVGFESAAGRTNVTVFYGDQTITESERRALPPGTRSEGVVRKCRLVERAAGEFALIPICLPDVPSLWPTDWSPLPEDGALFEGQRVSDAHGRFQMVALRASLEPLFLALRDIHAQREPLCDIYLPRLRPEDAGRTDGAVSGEGYDLAHLSVVYPGLDLARFRQRLAQTCKRAESVGRRLRARHWKQDAAMTPGHAALQDGARALLQVLGRETDVRAGEAWGDDGTPGAFVQGLTMREIMTLGERLGMPHAVVSACMDVLIDEALLVTRVERLDDARMGRWVGRTYLPDGEVASDLVRDYTRRYGVTVPPSEWA